MPSGEGSGPKRTTVEGILAFDRALAHLDCGHKEVRGGKLYLMQESGTVFGAVPFTIEGTMIIGSDGTQFDLENIDYMGRDGLYDYLRRMGGTEVPNLSGRRGQA